MRRVGRVFVGLFWGLFTAAVWLVVAAAAGVFVAGLLTKHWLWALGGIVILAGALWMGIILFRRSMSASRSGITRGP